jgi:hypothetical protein
MRQPALVQEPEDDFPDLAGIQFRLAAAAFTSLFRFRLSQFTLYHRVIFIRPFNVASESPVSTAVLGSVLRLRKSDSKVVDVVVTPHASPFKPAPHFLREDVV